MKTTRSFRDISIRRKLTLVVMLTSGCSLLLAGSLIVLYERGVYRSQMAHDLAAMAQVIGEQSNAAITFNDPKAAGENLAALERKPDIVAAALYDTKGKLFAKYLRGRGAHVALPQVAQPAGYTFSPDSLELSQPIGTDENEGTVYVVASLQQMRAHLTHDVEIVAGLMISLLIVTLVLSSGIQRAISDPILELARVAQAVRDEKNYSIRARGERGDELGLLTETFNSMLNRIEESDDALRAANTALQAEARERERADIALRSKSDEVRSMTQQLWHSAKLATMGELAASVAHELNNPMATVTLKLEALLMDMNPDDPAAKQLKIVEGEIDRMSGLVARLLQFSRRSQSQTSTINIPEEVERTLELVHSYLARRNIEVATSFSPDAPPVHADRQQLQQLFLNLITNASDAMQGGGKLRITVAASGENVVTEVIDTGSGIAPEDLNLVSEPFFTTKAEGKGTGLGLGICRRIVQEHQGTFDIESELGVGTTIRITLPAGRGGEDD